jgi:DNA-binding GntR family transcriptional regulator
LGVSRTPVRHGWRVLAFNFEQFEQLYDLRMVLETTAIDRLAEGPFQTYCCHSTAHLV